MTAIIILSIILIGLISLCAKPLWNYLTTKKEAESDYCDMKTGEYFTKEQMTKKLEFKRKLAIAGRILAITSPFWLYYLFLVAWYVFLGIGTILFCIELLAKGSGIK
jgi:hypothetical protein